MNLLNGFNDGMHASSGIGGGPSAFQAMRKENKMDTFIERLEEEKRQLDDKITKLDTFMKSEKFKEIKGAQMSLLNIQLNIMLAYSQCLLERIIDLNPDNL